MISPEKRYGTFCHTFFVPPPPILFSHINTMEIFSAYLLYRVNTKEQTSA